MSRASDPSPAVCFLLGVPRSGTTLLAHLLQQHPDITAPPEPWLLLALEALGTVDRGHPADATLVGLATNEFFGRIDRAATCRALADVAYNQYLAAAGKRCIIDKTPRYWMAAHFIDALYPEAPQIVLLRNPYAIAASLKSSWNIQLLSESCPPEHAPYLADLVLGLPVLAARRDHPKTQVVRYETLVAQPAEEVRRVVAGLGRDPAGITSTTTENTAYLRSGNFGDRKILEKKTVDDRSVDAWQAELSREEKQTVTDMVGAELLIALGYEQELRQAQAAGVVDRGEAVTQRHRRVFEAWQSLRSGDQPKAASGQPAIAAPQDEATALAQDHAKSDFDPSVLQEARRLAETDAAQALHLARAEISELQQAFAASEADRAARLDVIHERDAKIATLSGNLEKLQAAYDASEADRAARLDVIHERDAKIATLSGNLEKLQAAYDASEADRAARLDVIHERDAKIATLSGNLERLNNQIEESKATIGSLNIEKDTQLAIIRRYESTVDSIHSSLWWKAGRKMKVTPKS